MYASHQKIFGGIDESKLQFAFSKDFELCPFGKHHYCYWFRGERYSLVEQVDLFPGFACWEVCRLGRYSTKDEAELAIVEDIMNKYHVPLLGVKVIDEMQEKSCDEIMCWKEPVQKNDEVENRK